MSEGIDNPVTRANQSRILRDMNRFEFQKVELRNIYGVGQLARAQAGG